MIHSKRLYPNYLTKILIDLNRIWYAAETCRSDKSDTHLISAEHTDFILAEQFSREKPILT